MIKLFFKLKKKLEEKGFTLVELLAVIVILAIIMLIAIPGVLSVLESARLKTFAEYVDKSAGLAQKQIAEDQMNGSMASQCIIYNIKTDLGLDNTGSFEGWVLVDSNNNNIYITLFNEDYGLSAFHYNDPNSKVEDFIKNKSSFKEEQLTIEHLCSNSTCTSCVYSDEDGSKLVDNKEILRKNSAYLDTGERVNNVLFNLFFSSDHKYFKKADTLSDDPFKSDISTWNSDYKVWVWADGENVYYYTDAPSGKIIMNADSSSMFEQLFYVKSIDISDWDTSNVINMNKLFYNCPRLESINLSNFNTSNVTNMSYMFRHDTSIQNIDVTHFDTSKVTNMSWMFSDDENLKSLDVSKFNTSSVKDMSYMFYNTNLSEINVSNFVTNNLENMSNMFSSCENLQTVDLSKFNTSKVTDMSRLFFTCRSLKTIDLSKFNTSNVTNMESMFYGCWNLQSLDITNFDTSKVTDISYMFAYCSSLKNIDLSHFDTSKVTDMTYLFYSDEQLEKLDVSHFNTSNVESMSNMFSGLNIKTLDVSNFNTSNVTNMYGMFSHMPYIETLDLSNFNTSKVENMNSMFDSSNTSSGYTERSLKSINVSSFDTRNVTNMYRMFACDSKSCYDLKSLDLSSFDTSKVENMDEMFNNNPGLNEIIVSNKFVLKGDTSSSNMFYKCSALPNFNSSVINGSMAKDKNQGGYLTFKS